MDTNAENALMRNLEQQVAAGDPDYLPDGRPLKPGLLDMTVNPPTKNGGNATSNAKKPHKSEKLQRPNQTQQTQQTQRTQKIFVQPQSKTKLQAGAAASQQLVSDSAAEINKVTPQMVNRIEMFGAEAVYNAGEDN